MCGITGIVGQQKVDKALLARMRDAMRHRGPDGGGLWLNKAGTVGLAHRRLSIVDLSTAADQPMVSPDGQHALVFNGEIYNHAQVRRQLEAEGVTGWQTSHSDTEVILQAYRHWGMPACLKHLRGMFAFALWDADQGTLFAARDRAGEKPFYYTNHNNCFYFASEIKALLEDKTLPRAVDEEALFDYLSLLMTPAPRTLFAGIGKLPAAHWLAYTPADGTLTTQRYWDPLDEAAAHQGPQHGDDAAWAAHLKPILTDAVRLRQESADVPVGCFLSGGIDSSAVATLVSGHTGSGKLHTFAIGPDGTYPSWPDETPYAEKVAKRIGSHHTTTRLTEAEVLAFLPTFIHVQDEPVADPAAIPIYFLSKAATDAGLKVCQGGEGSDELFVGYEDWLKFAKLTRWNHLPIPRIFKKLGYALLLKFGHGPRFYAEYLRRAAAGQPIFWGGAEAFTDWEKRRLLAKPPTRTTWEVIAPIWQRFNTKPARQRHFWNWCSFLELHTRLPEQLLMRADKTSMATALELRIPLLDHHLIAATLASPEAVRVPNGDKKHLLKSMLKGLLPDDILYRKKQGLKVPFEEWIVSSYGAYARRELEEFCTTTPYLNWSYVQTLFEAGRGQHIWYLLNLALWHKHFIAQKPLTPFGLES
ncbi:MAG: asparagine synthase (glutamine-hydrolyzing) [Pseudomonadaceae bacterium]|nr:asparagine synthase (glutamine-hydrolyzing) [Pseudomonadaceae bacterium]